MLKSIKLLTPVEPVQMKLRHSLTSIKHSDINPMNVFRPIINSFAKLAIGRYFWVVVDFPKWINYDCGGDIEELTPLTHEQLYEKDHSTLHKITMPEDMNAVFAFSDYWIQHYVNSENINNETVRMSIYFRIMSRAGQFNWVMVQYPSAILNEVGKINYGLILVTDISHLRFPGPVMMTIFDEKEKIYQQFFAGKSQKILREMCEMPQISRREQQVLSLLARGLTSKEIASQLYISVKTVDNHRQNMLKKNRCKSSSELVSLTIRYGLIK